jgi:DNA-binding MarR family transcriptional regulator
MQKDNVADMIAKRRHPFGERRWNARLTNEAVRFIRATEMSGSDLARLFGVSPATITQIRKRRAWVLVE